MKVLTETDEITIDRLLKNAEDRYAAGCHRNELYQINNHMSTIISARLGYGKSEKDARLKRVRELGELRAKEDKIETVDDLIRQLQKLNGTSRIVAEVYESCITDAGTDLGGFEDRLIEDIKDLGGKVILTIDSSRIR